MNMRRPTVVSSIGSHPPKEASINYVTSLYQFYYPSYHHVTTVKLGDKERFDMEQIGVKEPIPPVTNLLNKDTEHMAIRNKKVPYQQVRLYYFTIVLRKSSRQIFENVVTIYMTILMTF